MRPVLLCAVLVAVLPANGWCQSRHILLSRKFEKTPDQARVVSAGYLGGGGTEWLVSGGFQPDGSVVVVGVTLGPELALGGVRATVLGKDAAPPKPPEPAPQRDKAGKVILDRKTNRPLTEPFAWTHENATAFVVRLSADLKEVKSVSRLPWKAGGATAAAVDDRGNIYLTGPARDGIDAVAVPTVLGPRDSGMKTGGCEQVYVAKLTPAVDRVLWLATLRGPSDAPSVQLTGDGKVRLQSADLRVLSAEGKPEAVTVVPGGITTRQGSTAVRTTAVHPRDGTIVRGGEHHWRTGREPYRDPILNVYRPDGTLRYELYNWDGPLVGLDNLRLVSDSAIRRVRFDGEGNLWLYAWSDGGNSVLYREPFDVRRTTDRLDGLGMSAWGAGVLSCAYLIKLDPTTFQVTGGTLWLAYLKDRDKPNSIWIDSLGFAGDGSVCIGGKSAWGLIQTGNALGKSEPTGPYVAVLNRDCTSLRFSSVLPGTGAVDVRDGERWGIVRGQRNGQPMALFVGSATDGAPVTAGMPARFGGGHSDGYLLLLDLSRSDK